MAERKKTTVPRMRRGDVHGSRRAQAWVHLVINELIEIVPIEISFLESGNVSWRYIGRRLENVQPIENYLSLNGRHALRDFLRSTTSARQLFEVHDQLVADLTTAAARAFDSLLASQEFRAAFDAASRGFSASEPGQQAFSLGASPNFALDLAAERVVNRIKSLPNYFVDSHFWESQAVRLLGFAEGPAFKTLESSRTTLLKHDARLTPWLENTASDLCEKYDIPAAPVVLSAE